MSDPLDTVRHVYAAFGRGDIPGLLALLSPDVDWRFIGDRRMPYTGRFRGHAGVGEWFGMVATHDHIEAFEPREFLAGPGHVTVIGFERTKDGTSGRVFECEWVHVWSVADGRVTRLWGMLDTEAAAAARG